MKGPRRFFASPRLLNVEIFARILAEFSFPPAKAEPHPTAKEGLWPRKIFFTPCLLFSLSSLSLLCSAKTRRTPKVCAFLPTGPLDSSHSPLYHAANVEGAQPNNGKREESG